MKFFSAVCRPDDNPRPRSPLRLRARVTSRGGPEGSGVGTLSLFACQLPACSNRVRWPHETNLWREGTRGSERLRGINIGCAGGQAHGNVDDREPQGPIQRPTGLSGRPGPRGRLPHTARTLAKSTGTGKAFLAAWHLPAGFKSCHTEGLLFAASIAIADRCRENFW
jgi:hypothetical protein